VVEGQAAGFVTFNADFRPISVPGCSNVNDGRHPQEDASVNPTPAAAAPEKKVFGEVLEGYTEAHLRHYRFCRCYSVGCPEGELGDVHVSTVLCLVSRAFFEALRQVGWQMEAGQRPRSACRMMESVRPPERRGPASLPADHLKAFARLALAEAADRCQTR